MGNAWYGSEGSELYPGTLRGYRGWILSKGPLTKRPMLRPAVHGGPWRPGLNRSKCQLALADRFGRTRREWHSFDPSCSCGFYAVHDLLDIPIIADAKTLYGSIKGSGVIVIGGRGFRTQKAEIEALFTDTICLGSFFDKLAQAAARRYGVPLYRSAEKLLKDFPPNEYRSKYRF